jgi:hypothetical protein
MYGGVQHILCCACLCMVVSNTYYVVLTCVWWCPTHIMLCLFVHDGVQHILCWCWTPPYTNKHNIICVGHHHNVRGVISCLGCVYLLVYGGVQHILCCAYLCMVVSNTYYVVLTCVWWCPMCWTPPYTIQHNMNDKMTHPLINLAIASMPINL